ncbi:MAG: flagellar hook-associated protein FlgK [Chloroflexota bacterium]
MSSFTALELGKRALLAQRFGLDVTSANIANVNTPGYSRRSAVISESPSIRVNGSYLGSGAEATGLRSFRQEFFDRELRATSSSLAGFELDEQMMQRLEGLLGEPSADGISETVGAMFSSFNELAQNPEDTALRGKVLMQIGALASRLNSVAEKFQAARNEAYTDLENKVKNANALAKDIASLNNSIELAKGKNGAEPQSLVDERAQKLEALTKLGQITVSYDEDGSANAFMNGIAIVTGGETNELTLSETVDSATGERTALLEAFNPAKNSKTSVAPAAGEIASLMKHYNVTLDNRDSSGGFSAYANLDKFASELATQLNAISINGYGLDDTGAVSPGRHIFEPIAGEITAANIKISADIAGAPRNLPLSGASAEPGNSVIARSLGRLGADSAFLDGFNPSNYFANFVGQVGSLYREATNGKATYKFMTDQLESQRESQMGVNLDEEAVNLIKFQKAFDASSRIVNTTNEILTTIVNLGR